MQQDPATMQQASQDTYIQSDNAPQGGAVDNSVMDVTDAYAKALATTGINLWGGESRAADERKSPESSWVETAIKKAKDVWGWAGDTKNQKNPLLQMALTGLANAQNNANKREMAAQQHQYDLARDNNNYANTRQTAADNSAAISAIPKRPGIIQGVLKRIDGTPVFNTNGTVKV